MLLKDTEMREIASILDTAYSAFDSYSPDEFFYELRPFGGNSEPLFWGECITDCMCGYLLIFHKLLLAYFLAFPTLFYVQEEDRDAPLEKMQPMGEEQELPFGIIMALQVLLLAYLKATGIWKMEDTFINLEPILEKESFSESEFEKKDKFLSASIHNAIMEVLPAEAKKAISPVDSPFYLLYMTQEGGRPYIMVHIWRSDILYQIHALECTRETELGKRILERAQRICSGITKERFASLDYMVNYWDENDKSFVTIFLDHDDFQENGCVTDKEFLYNMEYVWEVEQLKREIERYKRKYLTPTPQ